MCSAAVDVCLGVTCRRRRSTCQGNRETTFAPDDTRRQADGARHRTSRVWRRHAAQTGDWQTGDVIGRAFIADNLHWSNCLDVFCSLYTISKYKRKIFLCDRIVYMTSLWRIKPSWGIDRGNTSGSSQVLGCVRPAASITSSTAGRIVGEKLIFPEVMCLEFIAGGFGRLWSVPEANQRRCATCWQSGSGMGLVHSRDERTEIEDRQVANWWTYIWEVMWERRVGKLNPSLQCLNKCYICPLYLCAAER